MPVVLASLASALAYAFAAVLQQLAASAEAPEHNLRPSLLLALCRRPVWLAGVACSGLGLVLQMVALRRGSLTVVEPILVSGLVFAFPIGAVVRRRRLTARDLGAGAVVAAGLALFVVAAGPGGGTDEPSRLAWLVTVLAVVAPVGLLVLVSTYRRGALRAGLQATAAGIANGFSAALTKSVARQLGDSVHHGAGAAARAALESPQLYGLAVSLVVVMLLVQSAFQSGPISWSLPSLTALNPLTAVAIGIGALHEHVTLGVAACAAELAGLVATICGVALLGRSPMLEVGRQASSARPADVPGGEPDAGPPATPGTAQPEMASSGTSISAAVSEP